MGKNLLFKAFILLIVIFFHSFVLTPKIYAGTMGAVIDIAVARQTLRTIAPSVVKATPAGWGYAVAYFTVAGIAYYFIKSGGVTALNNWLNTQLGASPPDGSTVAVGTYVTFYITGGGTEIQCRAKKYSDTSWSYQVYISGNWTAENFGSGFTSISAAAAHAQAAWGTQGTSPHGFSPGAPSPTIPTDYGTPLQGSQPNFPDGTVKFTPGGAAQLNGTNPPGTATSLPDAEIDRMTAALGATQPVAGTQPPPNTGDNTLSNDANASIPWLQQIANYVSNLVGIKTDTGAIKTNTDNMIVGQSAQTTAIQNMSGKMDNIAAALNNQTNQDNAVIEKLDNVAQTTLSLKDAVTGTSASVETLSTRINSLKSLMSTKFPFSFIQGITVPTVQPGGTSLVPDIVLPTGQHWVVDPMQYTVIADFFSVVRSLVSLMMWAVFTLVMIRRVTQI